MKDDFLGSHWAERHADWSLAVKVLVETLRRWLRGGKTGQAEPSSRTRPGQHR